MVKLLTSILMALFLFGCATTPDIPEPETIVEPDCSLLIELVEKYMNKRAVDYVNQKADVLKIKVNISKYKCITSILARVTVDTYMEYIAPLPGKEDGPKVKYCATFQLEALAMYDSGSFRLEPQNMRLVELDICSR